MDRPTSHELKTASGLDLLRVCDREGRQLGHVFDLACRWTAGDEASPIDELIFGTIGLLERVGLHKRKPDSVQWTQVYEVLPKSLVISGHDGPSSGTQLE